MCGKGIRVPVPLMWRSQRSFPKAGRNLLAIAIITSCVTSAQSGLAQDHWQLETPFVQDLPQAKDASETQATSTSIPASSGLNEEELRPKVVYPFLRYDEDWRPFCNHKLHKSKFDEMKCLRLGRDHDSRLTLAGEAKEVYEYSDHQYWGLGPQDDSGWVLERYLLSVDWRFSDQLRLFSELQAGLENGRTGGPRPFDEDRPDIHQFFLDLRKTLPKGALTLRLGRQELQYGSGRLVEVRYGLNTRISFDGLKVAAKIKSTQVEAFVTRPTLQRAGFFNDTPDSQQIFWGVYSTFIPNEGSSWDLYYFGIDRKLATFSQSSGRYLAHTLGTRWSGQRGRWNFDEEANGQLGSFANGDVRAWSVASQIGYSLSTTLATPRLSLRSDVISGDNNETDRHLGSFFPLFAKGKYFGEADLNGPTNEINLIPSVDLHLSKAITLTPSYGVFWRESLHDGVYGFGGNLYQASTTSQKRLIGQQAEMDLSYQATATTVLRLVYERFLAGPYLRQATPGKDVNYATFWLDHHF